MDHSDLGKAFDLMNEKLYGNITAFIIAFGEEKGTVIGFPSQLDDVEDAMDSLSSLFVSTIEYLHSKKDKRPVIVIKSAILDSAFHILSSNEELKQSFIDELQKSAQDNN